MTPVFAYSLYAARSDEGGGGRNTAREKKKGKKRLRRMATGSFAHLYVRNDVLYKPSRKKRGKAQKKEEEGESVLGTRTSVHRAQR